MTRFLTLRSSRATLTTLVLVAVCLVAAWGNEARGQDTPPSTRQIEEAMATGNVKGLINAMSARVAIAVFGASREYSRTQAEYVLKDFFSEYPPAGFDSSQFSSTASGAFLAGRYHSTRRGRVIDVYFRLRDRAGKWEVREIIIRTEPR